MYIRLLDWTPEALERWHISKAAVWEVVSHVVGEKAGRSLVVLIYLTGGTGCSGEYLPGWRTPEDVHRGTVKGLSPRFLLIRIALGTDNTYPYATHDDYGWSWRFATVLDHLALVVSHENYHRCQPSFARRRANNEQHANRDALKHVLDLGFNVEGAPHGG